MSALTRCAAIVVTVAVAGCGSTGVAATPDRRHRPPRPTSSPTVTTTPTGLPTAAPTGVAITYPPACTARDGAELPDPACTHGALNPDVTPTTIQATICKRGWTATIRPPLSYSSKVKGLAIKAYGDYAGPSFGAYELDHLVPLELGGAPWDVRNLWPEHPASTNPKDDVESAARRAVCAGHLTLAEAQRDIAINWIMLGHQLGVTGIPAS